jgi:hypothetical protein
MPICLKEILCEEAGSEWTSSLEECCMYGTHIDGSIPVCNNFNGELCAHRTE